MLGMFWCLCRRCFLPSTQDVFRNKVNPSINQAQGRITARVGAFVSIKTTPNTKKNSMLKGEFRCARAMHVAHWQRREREKAHWGLSSPRTGWLCFRTEIQFRFDVVLLQKLLVCSVYASCACASTMLSSFRLRKTWIFWQRWAEFVLVRCPLQCT